MRAALAIFDPSQPAPDGSVWSWRASSVDRKLLDRLYYDIAVADRPEDPSTIGDSSIVGGFAAFDPDWVFAYRFGNGGRDVRGRPGRFVMVVAGLRRDEARGRDLAAVLTCPAVEEVLRKAPSCRPVPAPPELEVDVPAQPVRVDPVLLDQALREERLELAGPQALTQAAGLCGNLPADRPWSCGLRVDMQRSVAVVECPRAVEQPARLPSKPEAAERTAAAGPAPAERGRSSDLRPHVQRHWVRYSAVPAMIAVFVGVGWLVPYLRPTGTQTGTNSCITSTAATEPIRPDVATTQPIYGRPAGTQPFSGTPKEAG